MIKKSLQENQRELLEFFERECVEEGFDDVVRVLEKICECPVGCKLLRILTTKYGTNQTLKKVSFAQEEIRSFSFSYAHNKILFPCNFEQKPHHVVVIDEESKAYVGGEFLVTQDIALFHEMLHWLHFVCNEAFESTQPIEHLLKQNENLKDEFTKKFLIEHVYVNDEEYRTMFGLMTKDGKYLFDALNEAAYVVSSTNEKKFRISHVFKTQDVGPETVKKVVFLWGDKTVWEKIKEMKLPKFGESQYVHNLACQPEE